MKKFTLILVLISLTLLVKGQHKSDFKFMDHAMKVIVEIDVIDTTLKVVDTTYSVTNNLPYREIRYIYTNSANKNRQYFLKTYYDGKLWQFYQLRDEALLDLGIGTGLSVKYFWHLYTKVRRLITI